jgi:hypothetical protein
MPFTLSHPALVLPIRRYGFVFSALVIGSMAPDFSYFIPFTPDKGFTHTIPGILLFCIPISLIALLLFHNFLKEPLISLLPDNHRRRLLNYATGFTFLPKKRLFIILFSVFLGVISHVVWDSFTHVYGWGVIAFPVFRQTNFHIGSWSIAVYSFLQHLSTIIGLVVLGIWYFKWYLKTLPTHGIQRILISNRVRILIVFIMLFTAMLAAIISAVLNFPVVQSLHQIRLFTAQIAIISISTLVAEVLIYSTYWQFKNYRKDYVSFHRSE